LLPFRYILWASPHIVKDYSGARYSPTRTSKPLSLQTENIL
jgi:hypothetical protein